MHVIVCTCFRSTRRRRSLEIVSCKTANAAVLERNYVVCVPLRTEKQDEPRKVRAGTTVCLWRTTARTRNLLPDGRSHTWFLYLFAVGLCSPHYSITSDVFTAAMMCAWYTPHIHAGEHKRLLLDSYQNQIDSKRSHPA